MSDGIYRLSRAVGRSAFWSNGSAVVVNADATSNPGRCLLASNHSSPYDIPLMIVHARRPIDFVSITEVFAVPVVGRYYAAMNAFPLDRSRPDPKTLRTLVGRLKSERMVGMFPEGGFRAGAESVINGGPIRRGIGRIAIMTGSPILPCALYGTSVYSKFTAWLPLPRTRYGVAFGTRLPPPAPVDRATDRANAASLEDDLCDAIRSLHAELRTHPKLTSVADTTESKS